MPEPGSPTRDDAGLPRISASPSRPPTRPLDAPRSLDALDVPTVDVTDSALAGPGVTEPAHATPLFDVSGFDTDGLGTTVGMEVVFDDEPDAPTSSAEPGPTADPVADPPRPLLRRDRSAVRAPAEDQVWTRCVRCNQLMHVSVPRCPSCGRPSDTAGPASSTPPPTQAFGDGAPARTDDEAGPRADAWWNPAAGAVTESAQPTLPGTPSGPAPLPRSAPLPAGPPGTSPHPVISAAPGIHRDPPPPAQPLPVPIDPTPTEELPRDPTARLIAELVRGVPSVPVRDVPGHDVPSYEVRACEGPGGDAPVYDVPPRAAVAHEPAASMPAPMPMPMAVPLDMPMAVPLDMPMAGDVRPAPGAEVLGEPADRPAVLDRLRLPESVTSSMPAVLRDHLVLVALIAGGLAFTLVLVLLTALRGQDTGSTTPRPTTSAQQTAVAIDPESVTASASSVQDPDGGVTYEASNTLDGKADTAWNSNGQRDGKGPGITLTYVFAAPRDLRSITLLNGYQKTTTRNGKSSDLYALNSRVKTLRVTTSDGSWTWNLPDSRSPQTFVQDFGQTSKVTLEVVAVYPGSKFTDLAVSEISFTALPLE